MYIVRHCSIQELKKAQQKSRFSQFRQRIQIILLASSSKSRVFISQACGCARASVDYWVKRYNLEGLQGLKTRPRPRQPLPLNEEELQRFCKRIDFGPSLEEKICAFHGLDVKNILEKEFGKLRSLSGTYKLLHRLGYSLLAPRPKHYKADLDAQADFKKNFQSK